VAALESPAAVAAAAAAAVERVQAAVAAVLAAFHLFHLWAGVVGMAAAAAALPPASLRAVAADLVGVVAATFLLTVAPGDSAAVEAVQAGLGALEPATV
jgi:hypothetical protein